MYAGAVLPVQDDPGLCLARRAGQVLAREGVVRVDVDGQPFAGVEQLDEQRQVRAVLRDVGGTQPALGVRGDRVAQRLPVGQHGQAKPVLVGQGRRGPNPVLRPVVAGRRHPAERRDARAAL